MRSDLAGIDNTEAVALVEAPGTGVGGVVDQAQAVKPETTSTSARSAAGRNCSARALVSPALVQRQAGNVKGVGISIAASCPPCPDIAEMDF